MTDRDPATASPRRIAPQLGPLAWVGSTLSGSDYMLALGAEHGAELRSAGGAPSPRLDLLATALRERLDHGLGFALLRGLPREGDDDAALRRLAGGGVAVSGDRDGGVTGDADGALLLRAGGPAGVTLFSAAELHNRLLASDRAALAALYAAPPALEGAGPVFALRDNIFAARQRRDHPALAALLRDQAAVALRLPLRAGDVLALNPLLVWHEPLPAGVMIRLPGVSERARVFAAAAGGVEVGAPPEPPVNPQVGG